MPPTRAPARSVLLAALLLALPSPASHAQDAGSEAPSAQDAAPDAAKARPKPKSRPAPPKAAARAAPPAASAAGASAAPASLWPPGASTVSESYGDWTMTCTRPKEAVTCIVAQSQGDARTGRRQFGFELQTPREGRAEGMVVMPFGLAIEPGVTFKLDDQALGKGAPYTTCNGDGCLVSISFPTLALDGMRLARTLTVTGMKNGGTEPAAITVPLAGFPQAMDRAVALGG